MSFLCLVFEFKLGDCELSALALSYPWHCPVSYKKMMMKHDSFIEAFEPLPQLMDTIKEN